MHTKDNPKSNLEVYWVLLKNISEDLHTQTMVTPVISIKFPLITWSVSHCVCC